MLMDPGAAESSDLSLLKATTNALRLLAHPDKPFSYCTRLHKNFTWCMEIATLTHKLRRSVPPGTTKSGGGFFEQSTLEPCGFTRKDAPDPSPIVVTRPTPVIAPKPTHGLPMNDGPQYAKSGPSTESWSSIPSDFNPNDWNFLQSPDIFSNNNDDFGLKADNLTEMYTQPLEMTPGSSTQFQDALKWMFDKGNGLETGF